MTPQQIRAAVLRLCAMATAGEPARCEAWWAGTRWPPIPAHPDPFEATPEGEARLTQILEAR